MPKPLVDAIEGISPAVAIEQEEPHDQQPLDVGTATEIYDFLRLLWARTGTQHCVKCGSVVKTDTVQEVVDSLVEVGAQHAAPPRSWSRSRCDQRTPSRRRRSRAAARGRLRPAQLDGVLARLDPPDAEQRVREAREVLVVVDPPAAFRCDPGATRRRGRDRL